MDEEGEIEAETEDQYDRFRDYWSDRLDTEVEALINKFLADGYYRNCPQVLKQHLISVIKAVLE